jgi:hypothetical protein
LPRFAISCDPGDSSINTAPASGQQQQLDVTKELSPVDERQTPVDDDVRLKFDETTTIRQQRVRPSTTSGQQRHNNSSGGCNKVTNIIGKSGALHLVIPTSSPPISAPPSGQLSPGGRSSISSTSSIDGSSPIAVHHHHQTTIGGQELSPQVIQSVNAPTIVVKRGAQGYGFTIRSVRVYLGK